MAELSTLARPYAKAAFEYAIAANAITAWSQGLATTAAVAQQPVVDAALESPNLTADQKAQALIDLIGDSLNGAMQNFLHILAENRRLPLLAQISQQFEMFKAEREKSVDVEIASASKLDEVQTQKLIQALSNKLQRSVNMQVRVDKTLIGGLVVRTGDTVIDGSIRGRLAKLAELLHS